MKKIVFIYGGSSRKGGLSTYLKLLFENYNKEKIDLRLISIGKWGVTQEILDGGNKVKVINNYKLSPITLIKIIKYLKNEKIDLIITAGMLSNAYGRKTSLFTGIPVLTTVHSNYKYDYPGLLKRICYFLSDRGLRFRTSHYVAVSNYLKKELMNSGIPKDKIDVVYNGIEFKKVVKKGHVGIVVGSVGRLHKTKGFDILIKAIKELPGNVVLKIWGEGSECNDLEEIIRENGLAKRVFLEGFSENVQESLSIVDIYVQPSRMEGFGLAVSEAMAAELPVIVSPVGSLPELVENRKTGLILDELTSKDLVEKINILMEDDDLRKRLGSNGLESVKERFGVSMWIKNIEEIMLKVSK